MSEAAAKVVQGPFESIKGARVRVRECRHGLFCYLPHDHFIGRALDVYGEYSEHEASLFASILKPNMCAVEVGANIGCLTVPIAKAVGQGGRVFCYEPQRIIFQMLCANLAMNGIWCAWASQKAVGAEAGTMVVPPVNYTVEGNFGAVTLLPNTPEPAVERVPVVRLDDEEMPAPHLIKIDVEGMEADVIRGAHRVINEHRPMLFCENDREEKSAELVAALREHRYDMYWHVSTLFNGANFRAAKENIYLVPPEKEGALPVPYSSFNLLCVPSEYKMKVVGLLRVESDCESPGGYIMRMKL